MLSEKRHIIFIMMKMLLVTTSLTALIVAAVEQTNPNRGNYLRHNYDDRILKKIKWEQFADEIQESLASLTTAQPSISSTTYGPSASPTKVRFSFHWLYHILHFLSMTMTYVNSRFPVNVFIVVHIMVRHQQLHHQKSLHWLLLNSLLIILRR